jgi:hypothetical protein
MIIRIDDSDEIALPFEVFNVSLSVEFFFLFQRLEYSLKEMGYAEVKNGRVKINWEDYYKKLIPKCPGFDSNEDVLFLKKHPPKKQTVLDGRVEWKDFQPKGDEAIFAIISQVRNNLFHGSKMNSDDQGRDKSLLISCIKVIRKVIEVDADLKNVFCL